MARIWAMRARRGSAGMAARFLGAAFLGAAFLGATFLGADFFGVAVFFAAALGVAGLRGAAFFFTGDFFVFIGIGCAPECSAGRARGQA